MFKTSRPRGWISPGLLAAALVLAQGVALAAGPMYWDWPRGRDFSELEHEGTTLDTQGYLTRGLAGRQVGPAGPEVIWHLAGDGHGGCLAGTGHGGGLFRLDKDREQSLLAQLNGPDIFCTLVRSSGEILVGTGSEGGLYSVDEQGESTLLGQVDGGYVWAMAEDPASGNVWLATGSPAGLYRLDGKDQINLVSRLEAQNALAVMVDSRGRLLVGTQGPGLLYVLDRKVSEEPRVVLQAPQDEIRHFLQGPGDDLFFLALNSNVDEGGGPAGLNGVAANAAKMMDMFEVKPEHEVPRAALYSLGADDRWREYWAGELDLMMVAWSQSWGWLGGGPLDEQTGQSVIHTLVPPASSHPLASWPGGDVLDVLVMPRKGKDDAVLVAQAHPGSIRELVSPQGHQAVATSPPLDAGRPVRWGRLSWTGNRTGGEPRWSVRTGNQESLGEGWTAWSDWRQGPDLELDVPESRFLQWRVALPAGGEEAPVVSGVSVSAWQDNVAPVVSDLTLEQVIDISLGGMMSGGENITQSFRSGLKAEFSQSSVRTRRAGPERAAETRPLKVFSWRGRDANEDRLTYSLQYRPDQGGPWRAAVERTQESLGSWDTSALDDGEYRVRVVAHDGLDNPQPLRLEGQAELGPVTVDNTPPRLGELKVEAREGGFLVRFSAQDDLSSLAGAILTLPDGAEERLDPVDLICDSREEEFRVDVAWPRPESGSGDPVWTVAVEVWDLAGNVARSQGHLVRIK